ncbi:menaquinol-cytochrome c reductase cytochrome b subunit [Metabacillus malikii]|uniref:Menaquinol-cytochrome c reductase cytochrome b subunit n=1 Tax=Metabacillus malikii TaxID=1504265 RepID=A0ABT9ZBD2_9BACI|nr:menaquinol-cytochrome c reductase cytochrome b subunit [Metabacillus malikii]
MKLILQAFFCSIIIHIIYIVGMMLVSYIKTRNYKPDIASMWDKAETLQSEVVFGKVNSTFLSLYTFIGVTVICGIIIFFIM